MSCGHHLGKILMIFRLGPGHLSVTIICGVSCHWTVIP